MTSASALRQTGLDLAAVLSAIAADIDAPVLDLPASPYHVELCGPLEFKATFAGMMLHGPAGYGPTKQAAIADLLANTDDGEPSSEAYPAVDEEEQSAQDDRADRDWAEFYAEGDL